MTTPMPWWHADPLTDALYQVRMRGAFYSWTEASGEGSLEMPQFPDTLTLPHHRPRHRLPRGAGPGARPPRRRRARARPAGDRPSRLDLARARRSSAAPTSCRRRCSGDSFSIMRIGPEDAEAPARPAVRRRRVRVAGGARDARGAAADRPRRLVAASGDGGAPSAARRRAARSAPRRRRRRHPARRRARRRDRARVARRPVRRRRTAGSRRCAIRSSAPRSPPCIASPAIRGRWRRWRTAPRCRGRRSRHGSPPSSARRRWPTSRRSRMRAARGRCSPDGSTVGAVAAALGYGSEAAFSRAFTRITGETPGRVRRAAVAA